MPGATCGLACGCALQTVVHINGANCAVRFVWLCARMAALSGSCSATQSMSAMTLAGMQPGHLPAQTCILLWLHPVQLCGYPCCRRQTIYHISDRQIGAMAAGTRSAGGAAGSGEGPGVLLCGPAWRTAHGACDCQGRQTPPQLWPRCCSHACGRSRSC